MKIPLTIDPEVFNQIYIPALKQKSRYQIYYGGAGSGKSVFVAQKILILFFKGGHNFLVVRQVSKSNRHSTFALLKQLLTMYKIPADWYKINKTEMLITNTINGSQIICSGLDDVEKLKSFTFEHGILTDIWVEEASEIKESDMVQLDLRLRGKSNVPFTMTLTFNPIDINFWAKKRFFDEHKENTYILKTTYKDNRFLDEEYIKILENLKEKDFLYYSVYALGEWGVLGNKIYHNYVIHDFDIDKFSDFALGIDFGFNNPSAVLKMAMYDNEIYVCDEIYESRLTNSELIKKVENKFGKNIRTKADCAEADRIDEFRKAGVFIEGCKKGAYSVKDGIDYLRGIKIHIHKSNCHESANEIKSYKYREDKNGNVLDEPVKFKDHAMDAMRYGSEFWRRELKGEFKIETFGKYDY
ncbi:MAG: PBSX family phage terminase large subunit [Candidatus Cloacimonetes bacterium]|nr:PBSX family phage terminase large subunit [Candidatus Cloacimonadota bacterium]